MDETQRLDYNDDDEEETSVTRDRPVGNLHMFAGLHGPAQDFPIYCGQNLIGRNASCDVTLPAQSVSKKHAILEVRGDCRTICDNGSLNKTRRGKTALAPHVHYALASGDLLLFADVACRYTVETVVQAETSRTEESDEDSMLVPGTQGALAIEKTPAAAIRRRARGAVLAKDSGDEEEGQTRGDEGGIGSSKGHHMTSGPGTTLCPVTDTMVPESDEEVDPSTSEMHLPSLRCDSDPDTSRRSSFVPSSQNFSTPLVLIHPTKHKERTLTAKDNEEMESMERTNAEMKMRLSPKEKQAVQSTCSGSGSDPCGEVVGTVDDGLKKECERELGDALKPSSDSMPVRCPHPEDNVASSRSETVREAPGESNPKVDDASLDHESKSQEVLITSDVIAAKTSEIQTNKSEDNGRSLGSSVAVFHMDSDTDIEEDETTGSPLERVKSQQVAVTQEPEKQAHVTGRNQGGSDSVTDVDGDQKNVIKSKSDNEEVKKMMSEPKTEETAGLGTDSDTEHDHADVPKPVENKVDQDSRSNTEEKKEGFHLDSDTDVEEDVSTAEVKEAASPKTSVTEIKEVFSIDSDTDVDDEDIEVSSRNGTLGPQDFSTSSTKVQEETCAKSDNNDDQIPGGSNVTLKITADEPKDKTDVVTTKEAAAVLHVAEDDGSALTKVVEKVGASESTAPTDGTKKTAELHLDSDTDDEEGDGSSVSRLQKAQVEEKVDTSSIQGEVGVKDQKPSVSSASETVTVSVTSTEVTKKVPTEIGMLEDETQELDSEGVDLEMESTQSYLEVQESDEQEEEEATQAFIFSSTFAEPQTFKRPSDPMDALQISSVTVNTSEEDIDENAIDENAIAETQAYFSESEAVEPSVPETPEPSERASKTIQSSSREEKSGEEVQQLSRETMSPDATLSVSQYLASRPSPDSGTWLHLKKDDPSSVGRGAVQQVGDSTDLEGGNVTEDATQADDQSFKLELEVTHLNIGESPSVQKPPTHSLSPTVPAAEEKPPERTEQPCNEETQATDYKATQAYSLDVPSSENGTTQAEEIAENEATLAYSLGVPGSESGTTETTGDGAIQGTSIHIAGKEDAAKRK
ncbi:DNA repair [Pristimantis euphronides]